MAPYLLLVLPLAAAAQSPSRYAISPLAKLPADSLLTTRLNDAGLEQLLQAHFGLTPANFNENIRKRLAAS